MASIYKICTAGEWRLAQQCGAFAGSAVDHSEGFIHLSTATQVRETAAKHFATINDLVLVSVDPEKLGDALRWEPSRGGDLFPHLYAELPVGAVQTVQPLPQDESGRHVFPTLG